MGVSMEPRVPVLGVGISAVNMAQALDRIASWIERRQPRYVCVAPVHSILDCQEDEDLRGIFNASGMTTPDGVPLVWILRARGHRHVERVYGPDLMGAMFVRSAPRGYGHYFYGGTQDVLEALQASLRSQYPELKIAGAFAPPFRALTPDEDAEVCERIRQAGADIVWVGLGSPKQERWMAEHVGRVGAPVLIGVGAAFDFLSGRKRQAPRWMQRSGLEWLFRLMQEPRRLWPRYRRYPWFVMALIREWLGVGGRA